MMELPVDEDPACSRVPPFRAFSLAAGESGCEFSCRPENENNSKFAQFYSKFGFSNVSEVLASFFLHKNFNLFLIRNSTRKAWKLKCVRSSRLHFYLLSGRLENAKESFFLFQNFTVLDAGCSFSFGIFKFVLEFSMMELPVDEDPACSRVPRFRDFSLAAGESGCEFSCRPENENNSKFAQFFSKSNFVEESLDFQMCQKFSPPSSSTKISICF